MTYVYVTSDSLELLIKIIKKQASLIMQQPDGTELLNYSLVIHMGRKWTYGQQVKYSCEEYLGCIMGEITDGDPLFPGESEID